MLDSNLQIINNDVKTLIKDAQELFQSASTLTGEQAEEARNRAMRLLENAIVKGQEVQYRTTVAAKELVASADSYVKANPWCSAATALGVGFLIGLSICRK